MKELLGKPRAWLGIAILATVLILALGWLLLVSPQMSKASTLQEEAQSASDQALTLQGKASSLRKQAEKLPEMEAELKTLYQKLPDKAGVNDLIRQIDAANQASGMTVQSFSVDPPAPLAMPEVAAAAEAAAAPAEGASSAAAGEDAAAAPKAAAKPEALISYSTVSLDMKEGTFGQVVTYLDKLEGLDRALLITNVDINNGGGEAGASGTVSLTLNARIYMRPPTEGSSASPSASPTGGATPSPSAS